MSTYFGPCHIFSVLSTAILSILLILSAVLTFVFKRSAKIWVSALTKHFLLLYSPIRRNFQSCFTKVFGQIGFPTKIRNLCYRRLLFSTKQATSLRLWNTGLVSSRASLTSWGEGASLALAGHPSSDGFTIKMPYGVDILHRSASHPIFSYWLG